MNYTGDPRIIVRGRQAAGMTDWGTFYESVRDKGCTKYFVTIYPWNMYILIEIDLQDKIWKNSPI